MKLTGKAEKLFEEWLKGKYNFFATHRKVVGGLTTESDFIVNCHEIFYNLPESMQWGVIQDWADSIGYRLDVCSEYAFGIDYPRFLFKITSYKEIEVHYYPYRESKFKDIYGCGGYKGRQEARNAAIEKLSQLINEQ